MMDNLNHGCLQGGLAKLIGTYPASDLSLVRSALMWLSVAQRPLRAHELWLALQIRELEEVEHIECLLAETVAVDDQEAVSSLQYLLGSLISVRPDTNRTNRVYITLNNPQLSSPSIQGKVPALDFSTAQAHIFVGRVCMAICGVTTSQLAHVHEGSTSSSLISYAWRYWDTHLSLSGSGLDEQDVTSVADRMIHAVCTDTLVFLLALNKLFTGPITFLGIYDRARCTALVMDAQAAVQNSIRLLSWLVGGGNHCSGLATARRMVEASINVEGSAVPLLQSSGGALRGSKQQSKGQGLLERVQPMLGEAEGGLTRAFADLASGLRSIATVLAEWPLHNALLGEYKSKRSPFDILTNTANWMEGIAGYPFRGGACPLQSENPFLSTDKSGPGDRLRRGRFSPAKAGSDATRPTTWGANTEFNISPAARLVYKIKGLTLRRTPTATFTINSPNRPSSFASFPSAMAGLPPPLSITTLVINLIHHHLNPFRKQQQPPSSLPLPVFLPPQEISPLHLLTATTLAHLRRVFAPWLGQYPWSYHHPLTDLRLAISNPEVFVSDMLGYSWRGVAVGGGGGGGMWLEVGRVGGLVWVLVTGEYVFVRGMHTAAWLVAGYQLLLVGGEVGRTALGDALMGDWVKVPLVVWLLGCYLKDGLGPLIWRSVRCAARGQPGLLVVVIGVVGGVMTVLRYRSTFYIALEISGVFVFFGFMVVGLAVLGLQFFSDPLGLNVSTTCARARADQARSALPRGAMSRMEILRRTVLLSKED
ncbi:hypothetical protein C8A00DRAFT_32414 [Chaetomidium leptoderma]|uniref:Uncharacterized protein n=1 Tax=Chaetomidium leptoderma TaxID=669021 RepID=A0AAN6VPB4_9PEZI|nr:hypothetical protein C8A00DRAFT_32414 [Chaetomidium leptoderma]